jgi:hypothetical protein
MAIAKAEESRNWLNKNTSEELETAILTLLLYAKDRYVVEGQTYYTVEQIQRH